ncbi:extracellular solute-binding protein [bacterium]|nr:extracellular solute-binding protein [bacterium]
MLNPIVKRWLNRALIIAFVAAIIASIKVLEHVARETHGSAALSSSDKTAGTLTIITPHWEGIRVEFARAYNDWRIAQGNLPVRVEWLDVGGTSDIQRYIRSSFRNSPAGIGIDIFFGGGVDPYMAFAAEGLLAPCPVAPGILTNIPFELHGVPLYETNGLWYGAALSGFGILYNNVVLGKFGLPAPMTWEELGQPALRTWAGSADPRKSGSVHMMYEIILQAYGWDKGMQIIAALAGNVRGFVQTASAVPKDVAVGEIAAGLCIDVYAWSTIDEIGGDRLGFVLPKGLTVVNPDAIAMLKGAPRADLAQEFLSFVLSEAGQKIWMLKKGTAPGAPRTYDLNKMPMWPSLYGKYRGCTLFTDSPFEWTSAVKYDAAKGTVRNAIVKDYLGALFIDAHRECTRAWERVCTSPASNELRGIYMRFPMDEAAILNAATTAYANAEWRARALSDWSNDARRRYAEILKH